MFGGMGKRVTLLRDPDTANSVYDYVEDLGHAFEQACLVEPFLGGGSVRCLVVGREIVATARFESNGTDWRNNAAIGSHHSVVERTPRSRGSWTRWSNSSAAGSTASTCSGPGDGYVVNEVNHAPGFRAVATTSGVDVASAIGRYVREVLG